MIINQFYRRLNGTIIAQQHFVKPDENLYLNFSFKIKEIKIKKEIILFLGNEGSLELVIKPNNKIKKACQIYYLEHHEYGGWWIEWDGFRIIFKSSYKDLIDLLYDEIRIIEGNSEKFAYNKSNETSRLFRTICLGDAY